MVERWETLSRRTIANCRIFTLDAVRRKHGSNGVEGEFAVLNSPDWVNIIPLTAWNTVILIRQYRHGIDDCTLEVPGGIVEPGEDPAMAAMRECREETGFDAEHPAELLGKHFPNPALQNNTCYAYLWRNCAFRQPQALDEHEDIEVVEVPLEDIRYLISTGVIRHSLVLTAFFFYLNSQ